MDRERKLGDLPEWMRFLCTLVLGFALALTVFSLLTGMTILKRKGPPDSDTPTFGAY